MLNSKLRSESEMKIETDLVIFLLIILFIHRQEIIDEERIKIIQEHAEALIGFLPSEILRETDKTNFSFAAAKK